MAQQVQAPGTTLIPAGIPPELQQQFHLLSPEEQEYLIQNAAANGELVQGQLNDQTQECELIQDAEGQQWLCPIMYANTGLSLRHVHIARHIHDIQIAQQQQNINEQGQD